MHLQLPGRQQTNPADKQALCKPWLQSLFTVLNVHESGGDI